MSEPRNDPKPLSRPPAPIRRSWPWHRVRRPQTAARRSEPPACDCRAVTAHDERCAFRRYFTDPDRAGA